MFGIGFTELVLILVVALIVLGPERLVELSKEAGRVLRELRHASSRIHAEIEKVRENPEEKEQ